MKKKNADKNKLYNLLKKPIKNKKIDMKKNIYKFYYNSIINSEQNLYIFFIAIIIRYLNHFILLFHQNFKFLWNFKIFIIIRNYISYIGFEKYINSNSEKMNLIIFYFTFTILFIYIIIILLVIHIKKLQIKFLYNIITKFYLLINNGFGTLIYFIILSNINCKNKIYSNNLCDSDLKILNISLAAILMIIQILINFFNILFLYTNNFFFKFENSGTCKLFLILIELEKLYFALYFIIDKDHSIQKQFVLGLLCFYIFKIYLRFNNIIYFNRRIENLEIYFEGIYFYFLLMINYLAFMGQKKEDFASFFIMFLMSFVFSYSYQKFFEYWIFKSINDNLDLENSYDNESLCSLFCLSTINYDNRFYQNKFYTYIVLHNLKCKCDKCNCDKLIEKRMFYTKAIFKFLENC